jgi:hypothetical protein
MALDLTRKEKALLRQLAGQAWESELNRELDTLFKAFGLWANKELSAFELSDRIHEFHDGVSRDLYSRYTGSNPLPVVCGAIAVGILSEESLGSGLKGKLEPVIKAFREGMDK